MLLEKLTYFMAVAEEKNVSRAAQRLNITQPHLSRLMQSLEEELDANLIIRKNKGVELTEAGEKVYEYSRSILAEVGEMKAAVSSIEKERRYTLTIISLESFVPVVTALSKAFFKKNGKYQLNISASALNREAMELLEEGKADMAIIRETSRPKSSLERLVLGYEPWLITFMADSPLSRREGIVHAEEMENLPVLLPYNDTMINEYRNCMESQGVVPKISGTWSTLNSAVILTQNGLGCAVCPAGSKDLLDKAGVSYRRLDEEFYHYPTTLLWKRSNDGDPKIRKFVENAKELYPTDCFKH